MMQELKHEHNRSMRFCIKKILARPYIDPSNIHAWCMCTCQNIEAYVYSLAGRQRARTVLSTASNYTRYFGPATLFPGEITHAVRELTSPLASSPKKTHP
jgi:hypothetical protein